MLIFLDIVGMMDSIYNLFTVLLSPEFYINRLEDNSTWNSENSCMLAVGCVGVVFCQAIDPIQTIKT